MKLFRNIEKEYKEYINQRPVYQRLLCSMLLSGPYADHLQEACQHRCLKYVELDVDLLIDLLQSTGSYHLIIIQRNPSKVWQQSFKDRLRIRFKTHHSKRSTCLKHRAIIRRLGHCPPARRSQVEILQRHLKRQRDDRQVYWASRARSRLESSHPYVYHLCGIIDSMDAAKHAWPRSQVLSSKDFSAMNRPRLTVTSTTLILQGHCLCLALSPSTVTSNSSRTAEIISRGLTMVSKTVDLRSVSLTLQGDNCCRELKNNGILRCLGAWVVQHKLKSSEISCLSSGHSHEDIDALFGHLRSWINSHTELPTPASFRSCLEAYFKDPTRRPNEPLREVVMMNQYRDWSLQQTSNVLLIDLLQYVLDHLQSGGTL